MNIINLTDFETLELIEFIERNKKLVSSVELKRRLNLKYTLYPCGDYKSSTWQGEAQRVIVELPNNKSRDIGVFQTVEAVTESYTEEA